MGAPLAEMTSVVAIVIPIPHHLGTETGKGRRLNGAVCRLVAGKIMLFDGQHKSAARIWAGRKALDCKVDIDPDVRLLKDTNPIAHDKLRQMAFFTSTLIPSCILKITNV